MRLAGTAIKHLHVDASDDHDVHDELSEPADLLARQTALVSDWYAALGAGFASVPARFPPVDGGRGDSFLDVVLPAVHCSDRAATHAEQLLWSGQYVGDVDQLRAYLLAPAEQVAVARARPWWQR